MIQKQNAIMSTRMTAQILKKLNDVVVLSQNAFISPNLSWGQNRKNDKNHINKNHITYLLRPLFFWKLVGRSLLFGPTFSYFKKPPRSTEVTLHLLVFVFRLFVPIFVSLAILVLMKDGFHEDFEKLKFGDIQHCLGKKYILRKKLSPVRPWNNLHIIICFMPLLEQKHIGEPILRFHIRFQGCTPGL